MQMHKHGGDIYSQPYQIDFSANINPFGMPQSVKQAAYDGIEASVNYPDISCRQLKKKLSEKIKIPKEYLIFGNGAAEVIFSVVGALKPKKTLVTAPGFAEYEHAVRVFGGEVEPYFLDEKKRISDRKNVSGSNQSGHRSCIFMQSEQSDRTVGRTRIFNGNFKTMSPVWNISCDR